MIQPFIIRHPTSADAQDLAEIHVRSWQAAYRGLLPDELLNNLSVAQRLPFWTRTVEQNPTSVLVGVEGGENGRLVGFVSFGPSRDEDANPDTSAEIYAIYLLAESWGHGYGAKLWQAALARLQTESYQDVMLWVLKGNDRAIRFYQAAGFATDGGAKTENYRDIAELHELRYRRKL
ncbi:MAG: GNAT family N-acetyltransferase [Chloroflexota bacterium]